MIFKTIQISCICILLFILTGCAKKSNYAGSSDLMPPVVAKNFTATGIFSDSYTAFFPSYTATRSASATYSVTYPDDTTILVTGPRYYITMGNYTDSTTAMLMSADLVYRGKPKPDSSYILNNDVQSSYIHIKNDTLYIHLHSGSGCAEYSEVSDFIGKLNK